jgi:hypothetical protein
MFVEHGSSEEKRMTDDTTHVTCFRIPDAQHRDRPLRRENDDQDYLMSLGERFKVAMARQ